MGVLVLCAILLVAVFGVLALVVLDAHSTRPWPPFPAPPRHVRLVRDDSPPALPGPVTGESPYDWNDPTA